MTAVTAWYVRHGHNPANQARQLSHKVIDYPLTDLGATQATALAGQLAARADPGPAAIYASPLRRAAQTAEIIAARTGSDVAIIEGLRELDVGDLDGSCDEEAWAVYHQVLADWRAGRHDSAFPGGEDYHQMTARLTTAIGSALRHPPGSLVLIVGHGGIIRAAIPASAPATCRPPATCPTAASPSWNSTRRPPAPHASSSTGHSPSPHKAGCQAPSRVRADQPPRGGHAYTSSSAGQPGGAYRATATITWDVTWQEAEGAGGALPPLFTTAVAAFRVAESQALNTSGGT